MAVLWQSQVRVYHLVHSLSRTMVRLELVQLACVSLIPFSTALIGEHGSLPAAAVVYAANMLAVTLAGALRTRELLHVARVHVDAIDPLALRTLKLRSYALPACAAAAFVLGLVSPTRTAGHAADGAGAIRGALLSRRAPSAGASGAQIASS